MVTIDSTKLSLDVVVSTKDIDSNLITTSETVRNLAISMGTISLLKGDQGDPGVSVTHSWNGTVLSLTSASGTTSVDLMGPKGDTGDMDSSVYDSNHNGIVDNAEKVNNHTVESDVPINAKFTDTIYTAGTGILITDGVISNTNVSAIWGNVTGNLNNQVDLLNYLNSKADKSTTYTKTEVSNLVDAKLNILGYVPENSVNKVTEINADSTNVLYPSALAVYNGLSSKMDNVTLAAVATTGSYNSLSDKPTIPTIPNSLKNPYSLSFGTKSYDGSSAQTITLDDLGGIASVNWSSITNAPTTVLGYGITDAKIVDGVITLGNASIIPLTLHQSLADYALKSELPTTQRISNWDTAYTFVNSVTGTDTDALINKWAEVVAFLNGIDEGDTLQGLIDNINNSVSAETTRATNAETALGTRIDGIHTHASGGGGGLIQTVYGYSNLGQTFSDATLSDTFNAYTINQLASRLTAVESGALTSVDWSIINGRPTNVSFFTNDSGYVTASVVNGYATQSWVSSNFNNYTLPTATASVLGGIKVGTGLAIASSVLSVTYGTTAGTSCQGNDSRLSDARVASDVYSWAKAASKPTYTWSEIENRPTALSSFTNDSGYITSSASITGNAVTATTLQTARTIWGQSFDGSGNISGAITGATTITASDAVTVGSLLSTGGIAAYTTSDKRLKTNIVDFNAIELIKSLGGIYSFRYTNEAILRDKTLSEHSYGVMALNLQGTVLSDLVTENDGYLGVNYASPKLISLALKGVIEVNDEATVLKNKIKELENKVNQLECIV